ncbi:MAG: putative DNA binding domain-containing protein [Magnetococcales bacterium]|nr:putative DNA binding domain-containing protein [Magnetococcales bacterium]
MTDEELIALLTDLESDRVERKESFTERDKIRQAICAFANDMPNHRLPGVLFIGEKDRGGWSGLTIDDALLLKLAHVRSDGNILPFPVMSVEKRTLLERTLAVIIVQPSDSPPVRADGRTWIRVGPRRAVATVAEEHRLSEKQRGRNLPHDLTPIRQATLDDLDRDFFSRTYLPCAVAPETLEENHRPYAHQLASLRFTTSDPPPVPTVVGLLAVGRSPVEFLPGAYVQFVRFAGLDMADGQILDQKEIHGTIHDQLRQLEELFRLHNRVATDLMAGPTEVRRSDYPLTALQQLARNAIMHRDYCTSHAPVRVYWFDDRVEIQNPGGPFGQVNRENFGAPNVTDYRNPNVAEVMKNLGYVQRFGAGIAMARKALHQNGNPPPEFTIEENHVLVTLRQRS